MRSLEATTAWQKAALGDLGPLTPVIVGTRVTDGRLVPVIDWFFNSAPDVPAEGLAEPPAKPDEKVQIGPLDV